MRFALSDRPGAIRDFKCYLTRDFDSFYAALGAYLESVAYPALSGARIAAAGPATIDEIRLTNLPWHIVASDVSALVGGGPVALFNDLEGLAHVLPHLGSDDIEALYRVTAPDTTGGRCAINMGTGFGAATSCLVRGGVTGVVASEAGHMSFAAREQDEIGLLDRFATVEDMMCGAGVVRLYRALRDMDGSCTGDVPETAQDILDHATSDDIASKTLAVITRALGRVAGDYVLATASWGGVHFCGSVARHWRRVANMDMFREAFIDKGSMRKRMEHVPCAVITMNDPTLIGLSHAVK